MKKTFFLKKKYHIILQVLNEAQRENELERGEIWHQKLEYDLFAQANNLTHFTRDNYKM